MSSVRQKMAATQKAQNKAEEQARLGVEAVAPVVEQPAVEPTPEEPKKPAPKKAAPKKPAAKKAAAPKKAPAKKKTTTSSAPKGKK